MTPLSKTVHRNYDLVCSLRLFPRSSFTVPSGWLQSVCVCDSVCACVCVSAVSLYGPFLAVKSRKGMKQEEEVRSSEASFLSAKDNQGFSEKSGLQSSLHLVPYHNTYMMIS